MALSNTRQNLVESVLSRVNLPDEITIRSWAESDVSAIQQLCKMAGLQIELDVPGTLTAWRQSWPTLIATRGETIVGFLRAITDGIATTYIAEILVAPEWREKGIGIALVETCHQLFPSTQLDSLSSKIVDAIDEAKEFCQLQGFRRTFQENAHGERA